MRLLLIGAFPYPVPQGSQVFATDQARALARAGAEVTLATYGRGEEAPPTDIEWLPSSRCAAPRRTRSGPSLAKPFADAALVATVTRAQRARRFDLALAHNAEAALVAEAARRLCGLRFVYVAHTLLAQELSAYAPARYASWLEPLDRLGAAIDRRAARSADGVIALCGAAERALAPHTRGPIARIPPGFDPTRSGEQPSEADRHAACAALGLEPRRFFLYAGNLDGYQELDLLDAAAAQLGPGSPPVVVATHETSGARRFAALRVEKTSLETTRALACEASALVLTRRRTGGFPIKLLNYMQTGRPIVAFETVAEGLVDGESARLLDAAATPKQLAEALRELDANPDLAAALGAAARERLRIHHDWGELASRTLALCREIRTT